MLEDRLTPVATPVAVLGLPTTTPLIGQQDLGLSVTFQNNGTTPGYGPWAYVILDSTGVDGNDGITFDPSVAPNYLGIPVAFQVLTITDNSGTLSAPAPSWARNPATNAGLTVLPGASGHTGDQVIFFQLPFGSFAAGQPNGTVRFQADVSHLADLTSPLNLAAGAGFTFGNTELDDAPGDPPLLQSNTATASLTPRLFTFEKTLITEEGEVATGASRPRQYRIDVRVAPQLSATQQQVLANFRITDVLPDTIQFVRVDSVFGNGSTTQTQTASPWTAPNPTTGGTLQYTFNRIAGDADANSVDASLLFTFFVPENITGGADVLPLNDGAFRNILNGDPATTPVSGSGTWTPIDVRDATGLQSQTLQSPIVLEAQSIAVQKGNAIVGGGQTAPGATVQYTLNYQVSDYFSFDNVVITDVLPDGIRFDGSFMPQLSFTSHTGNTTILLPFSAANYTVNPPDPLTGQQTITFRVSDELRARFPGLGSAGGRLVGANIPTPGTGGADPNDYNYTAPNTFTADNVATGGQIVYRGTIQHDYLIPKPGSNDDVKQGDSLTNTATITGTILNHTNLTVTAITRTDNTASTVSIRRGEVAKSIYAVNGVAPAAGIPQLQPGDLVTFRLSYLLPTSTVQDFKLTDFLPLPVFASTTVTLNNWAAGTSASVPLEGQAKWGPGLASPPASIALPPGTINYTDASLGFAPPAISSDATANSLAFTFPQFLQDPQLVERSSLVDILFTVRVNGQPFADGLFLTNQVNATESNSAPVSSTTDQIVQVQLLGPAVTISKGAVTSDRPSATFTPAAVGPASATFNAPGIAGFAGTVTSAGLAANPINSNVAGIDAADRVKFAIVIHNVGSGPNGAFNIRFNDDLPLGFNIPTLGQGGFNFEIRLGNGTVLTPGTSAGQFFAVNGGADTIQGNADDVFEIFSAAGLELVDGGTTGALARGKLSDGVTLNATGSNLIVVTYDLIANPTVQPSATLRNTANLLQYTSIETGGSNFLNADGLPNSDSAQATTRPPEQSKVLVGTEIDGPGNSGGDSSGGQATIGELVTYTVTITVPEGTTSAAQIVDLLDPGLAFVDILGVTLSSGLSTTIAGVASGNSAAVNAAALTTNGLSVASVGGQFGRQATFNFNTLTNSNTNNNTPETITITYRAVVLNTNSGSADNQAGGQRNNAAQFQWAGNTGTLATVSANNIVIVEPTLDIIKAVSPGTADADDTITYTVTIRHTGGSSAFDVTLNDPIPALILNPTFVASNPITGSGATFSATPGIDFEIVNVAGSFFLRTTSNANTNGTVDIQPNGEIVLVFSGTLAAGVTPGQVITNTATGTWSSLNGNVTTARSSNPLSTERTGVTTDPGGTANNYTDPGQVNLMVISDPVKSITSTSEVHTGNGQATIGEIVRYRLQMQIPESDALANFQLQDELPLGMTFLNDGTVRYAFVSSVANGITSSTLVGIPNTNDPNVNLAVTGGSGFILPFSAISGGAFTDGVDPIFSFGNLVNSDRDGGAEYVIVEFNAIVSNVVDNVSGRILNNDFIVRIGNQAGPASNTVTTQVVQPSITNLAKSAGDTSVDGTQLVTYTITYRNTGTATAFEARLTDTLAGGSLTNLTNVRVARDVGSTGTFAILGSGFTNSSTGSFLDVTLGQVAVNDTIRIQYDAIIPASAVPGTTILNTANLTYTSLTGGNGTLDNPTGSTTGGAGGTTGERTGTGGVNSYADNDDETVTVNRHTISGVVYRDLNNNGIQSGAGETGIAGVTVTLTGTDHLGNPLTLIATTNASGAYSFGNLRPSNANGYTVTETQPGGFLDGRETLGSLPTGWSAPAPSINDTLGAFTISVGTDTSSSTLNNFGELPPATISGFVHHDINNNGLRDDGATGIGGVTVTLTGTDDLGAIIPIIISTNPDGSYSFGNLRPGTYIVTETQPPAYIDGLDRRDSTPIANSTTTDFINSIVVTAGNTAPNNNFGELAPAAVTGYVYVDPNNDGIRVNGDTSITGVPIRLTGTDDRGNTVTLNTTTNSSGFYEFTGLRPLTNVVVIQVTQPTGFLDGRETLDNAAGFDGGNPGSLTLPNLLQGTTDPNNNFGELAPGSLSGVVYVDIDGSGTLTTGDTRLPNVTVTLTGTNDLGLITSVVLTTLADGSYNFGDLRPGTYTITETQPATYLDGPENIGSLGAGATGDTATTSQFSTITLPIGGNGINYNFGEIEGASISGFVYIDPDNNGLRAGTETAISNVVLTLTGTDDLGNSITRTTTTNGSGFYEFLNVRPGNYTVTETHPAGFLDGQDTRGNAIALPGSATADVVAGIVIPAGHGPGFAVTNNNFGELRPVTVSGIVYVDANNNGIQDGGESGIDGVSVTLQGTNDLGVITPLTITTGPGGAYSFINLRPGTYTLIETQPATHLDGQETTDNTLATVIPGSGGGPNIVNLGPLVEGDSDPRNNFGELLPGVISGFVYHDVNDNGLRDDGATGLAGALVTLTGTNDLGSVTLTATTAADGSYSFGNLRPGTYTVTETTPPAGYIDGLDARIGVVIANSRSTDVISPPLAIASGDSRAENNFGELLPATVTGTVYHDLNNNGLQGGGEPGIGGVTVTLTGTDDRGQSVNVSVVTGLDGTYNFTGLRPDNGSGYTLTETQPVAYFDGADNNDGVVIANSRTTDTITLPSLDQGATDAANNFGELLPSAVTGYVYVDPNNDGIRVNGDTPIAGVPIQLTGSDDRGITVTLNTTTNSSGFYEFTGLRPLTNVVVIQVTQPTGFLDGLETTNNTSGFNGGNPGTLTPFNLLQGTTDPDNNFGELPPGSLAGVVYVDIDGSGTLTGGDTRLQNVMVTLTGTNDLGAITPVAVTTLADGSYSFGNLRPGTYTITETQPAAYLDGPENVGSLGAGATVDSEFGDIILSIGGIGINYNFGELEPARITGFVYVDPNNDGLRTGAETAIGSVTLTLTGTDDLGNSISRTTTTNGSGFYEFLNVRPGNYTVTETQPAGFLDGQDTRGNVTALPGSATTEVIAGIVIPAAHGTGFTAANNNFGELRPITVSGVVYEDDDNDGIQDPGEDGIAGVTVTLQGTDDLGAILPPFTFITDSSGAYSFIDLRPGTYTLIETQPAGYLDGQETTDNTLATVIPGSGGGPNIITVGVLAEGTNDPRNNFGELLPGVISGFVYHDVNDNGLRDDGATGLAGALVTLTGTDDLGSVSLTATTLGNGSYSFGDLRPGTYTVTETNPPADYIDGLDARIGVVIAGSKSTDVITPPIVIAAGDSRAENNFGELLPAAVTGTVYEDLNNDGDQDSLEPGIGGVTITLRGFDDRGLSVDVSTVTGPDGTYTFGNLRPDDGNGYTLTETQPTGYLDGADNNDGVVIANSRITDTITLPSLVQGETDAENNFGELPPATISGFVYVDGNNDGIHAGGDTGIVTQVTLNGTNDLGPIAPIMISTNSAGSYSFGNLRPGTYTVTETQPADFFDGLDAVDNTVIPGSATSSVIATENLPPITVVADQNATNNNFGELVPATLSGTVYVDQNFSGTFNGGDTTLIGVTVTLTGTNDLGQAVSVPTTTDGFGNYTFTNLRPGSYTLTETQPYGSPATYVDGPENTGSLGAAATLDNTFIGIIVASGNSGIDYDFGELPTADLSLTKTLTPLAGPYAVGQNVTYTITVTNNGPVNATEVTVRDILPSQVQFISADGAYSTATNLWTIGNLASGATATLEIVVQIRQLGVINNTAEIAGMFERDIDSTPGNGVPGEDDQDTVVLNAATGFTISGTVILERNSSADGDLDGGNSWERGLGGVEIVLTGTDFNGNSVTATTTTAANGTYQFTNVLPGSYTVTEIQPTLYGSFTPAGQTLNNRPVTIDDENVSGIDFSDTTGSLAGRVFADPKNDGIFNDSDFGLAGVTVALIGITLDGTPVTATTTTNALGFYRFDDLAAGTYTMVESQATVPTTALGPYFDSRDLPGSLSGTNPINDNLVVGLGAGLDGTDYNFAEVPPADPQGYVWNDVDNDGEFEFATENGINGVTIRLRGIDVFGNLVNRTTTTAFNPLTGENGFYQFATNLAPGIYTITEVQQPAGFLDGREQNSTTNPAGDVDNDEFRQVDLTGAPFLGGDYNFGELTPSSLRGYVWLDTNNDGIRQASERGVAGATVRLIGTNDLAQPVDVSITTNATGGYGFLKMRPGTYRIVETHPIGILDGRDSAGTLSPTLPGSAIGTAGNDVINNIVLGAGQNGVDYRFGERGIVSKNQFLASTGAVVVGTVHPTGNAFVAASQADPSGYVYLDVNRNGQRDAGEPGIAGVQITLAGETAFGRYESSQRTDIDGFYRFDKLEAGVYELRETQPAGYLDGSESLGTLGGVVHNDRFSQIVLGPNDNGMDYNFGELPLQSQASSPSAASDNHDTYFAKPSLMVQDRWFSNQNVLAAVLAAIRRR